MSILLFASCESNLENITVFTKPSHKSIQLRYSSKHQKFFRISIPMEVYIINNSINVKNIHNLKYQYSTHHKGSATSVYSSTDERIKNYNIELKPYSENKFTVYSNHRIDTLPKLQKRLSGYITDGITNDTTINIEAVSNFSINNNDIFNYLVANDSLEIRLEKGKGTEEKIILNSGKGESFQKTVYNVLSEQIIIPIEWL